MPFPSLIGPRMNRFGLEGSGEPLSALAVRRSAKAATTFPNEAPRWGGPVSDGTRSTAPFEPSHKVGFTAPLRSRYVDHRHSQKVASDARSAHRLRETSRRVEASRPKEAPPLPLRCTPPMSALLTCKMCESNAIMPIGQTAPLSILLFGTSAPCHDVVSGKGSARDFRVADNVVPVLRRVL